MTLLAGGQEGPPQAERAAPARPLTGRLSGLPDPARSTALASGMRLVSLDVWRGLALLAMVVDHVALVSPLSDVFRVFPGRAAMPLFFLIAGALVTRLSRRHVQALGLGLFLPVLVPWIDNPNVLVWWALGCAALVAMRRLRVPMWLPAVVALTAYANGWGHGLDGSYGPLALLALMGLGAMLPLSTWRLGARLPRRLLVPVRWVGVHALSIYVLHLLLLQVILIGIEGWYP